MQPVIELNWVRKSMSACLAHQLVVHVSIIHSMLCIRSGVILRILIIAPGWTKLWMRTSMPAATCTNRTKDCIRAQTTTLQPAKTKVTSAEQEDLQASRMGSCFRQPVACYLITFCQWKEKHCVFIISTRMSPN